MTLKISQKQEESFVLPPPGREAPEAVRLLYKDICSLRTDLDNALCPTFFRRIAENILPERVRLRLFHRHYQEVENLSLELLQRMAEYQRYLDLARERRDKVIAQGNIFGRSLLEELGINMATVELPEALQELLQIICVVAGDLMLRMKLASSPALVARAVPALLKEAENCGSGEGRLSFIENHVRELLLCVETAEELSRRPASQRNDALIRDLSSKKLKEQSAIQAITNLARIANVPVPGSQSVH